MSSSIPETFTAIPQDRKEYQKLIKGKLSEYVKRKILKSNYDELIKKYQNTDQKW